MSVRIRQSVIGAPIDIISWGSAIERIGLWAAARESRVVCICNAHSVVTYRHDKGFADAVNASDMATADGFPVAFMLRRLGFPQQRRINGPDLMLRYSQAAAERGESVYLYGGTARTLELLRAELAARFPGLVIAGWKSPPFRDLTDDEASSIVDEINESNAGVVWVGLGCPKQEKWMLAHKGRINAVMIGVGAAFDYHAGTVKRAPHWMQRSGLEWFHRLVQEPKRLWRRYLTTNTRFLWHAAKQLASKRRSFQ